MSRRWSDASPRDHYGRVDTNDCSVDPRIVGQRVAVSADLHWVRVLDAGQLVADHDRCW